MALNGNTLGTAISSALAGLSQSQLEDLETVWKTIAGEIVNHITANAVVNPAGGPPPLTAPSGGGPVTGFGIVQ